jgi:hypothetical protein
MLIYCRFANAAWIVMRGKITSLNRAKAEVYAMLVSMRIAWKPVLRCAEDQIRRIPQ